MHSGKAIKWPKETSMCAAEIKAWWGSDGAGLYCTMCSSQLLRGVFLSFHRFPEWLSTPRAQQALWGVSDCLE